MHMRIRYHFLADLHITRYAVHTAFNQIWENNTKGWANDYSETGQTGFQ